MSRWYIFLRVLFCNMCSLPRPSLRERGGNGCVYVSLCVRILRARI